MKIFKYKPYSLITVFILSATLIIPSLSCNPANTDTTLSVWIEHPDIKGFTLAKPEGWEHVFQPSADVVVQLTDPEKCNGSEAGLYIITRTSFTDEDISIENLIQKSRTSNNDTNSKKYKYISDRQMEINGMPAGEIVWRVTGNSVEAEQWDFVIYKNNLFIFYCFASQNCWEEYKPVFDEIISSFKLILK